MRSLLIVVIAMLFLALPVFAESTQQYNKIFLNPFYRGEMLGNTNYSYTIEVSPPDRIKTVASAIISFDVYLNPSRNFTLWVNNRVCNTPNFFVSTTFAGAGQARINFDCTNVINQSGTYGVVLRSSGVNGAVNGWLDITYMNNPKGEITIHGTEYFPDDNGRVFIQLLNEQENGINDAICSLRIYYPNNTIFKSSAMTNLNISNGLYYYDFNVSHVTGVYMTEATCFTPVEPTNLTTYFGRLGSENSLRANLNITLLTESFGTLGSGETSCIGDEWEDVPNDFGGRITKTDNITNIYGWFYSSAGRTPRVNISFQKQNFDTNEVVHIGTSTLLPVLSTTPTRFVFPNLTANLFFGENEKLVVQICLTNLQGGAEFFFDFNNETRDSQFLRTANQVNLTQAITYRGSGEVHVNSPINFTPISENLSFVLYDLNQINMTTQETRGIVRNQANLTAAEVWDFTSRTLTDYNLSEILSILQNSVLPNLNFLANITSRINLTSIDIFGIVNNQANLTASQVWSFENRTVTGANFTNISLALSNVSLELESLRNLTFYLRTDRILLGTEYFKAGENSRIWVQILQGNSPETGATCNATIYYPNLTIFVNQAAMTYLNNGIYYLNVTIPSPDGIYVTEAVCTKGGNNWFATGEIHVSDFVNVQLEQLINATSANLTQSNITINPTFNITPTFNNSFEFNITPTFNLSPTFNNTFEINVTVNPTFNISPTFNITALFNISGNNLTAEDVWSYFNRTLTDYNSTEVNFSQILTFLQEINLTTHDIRGIVFNQANLTASQVWSFGTRTLTDYNQSGMNQFLTDINNTVTIINNKNFTFSGNVTFNVTANVNSTEIVEGILSADVTEFTFTSGQTSYGTGINRVSGLSVLPNTVPQQQSPRQDNWLLYFIGFVVLIGIIGFYIWRRSR